MDLFLSCDWGTSSLRLRLIQLPGCMVIAEVTSGEGIAATYEQWQKTALSKRQFYLHVLQKHIRAIEKEQSKSLAGIMLIISGMASSSIGFIDIPYSVLPLNIRNATISTALLEADKSFNYESIIISGVKTDDDVMRGEETQLIGYAAMHPKPIGNALFIFPGTHSKHIEITNDEITGIKTFMTGEFFELLSQKSILNASVIPNSDFDEISFEKGLSAALEGDLLNTVFHVRTNSLFGKLNRRQNYYYLSGLLIGSELKNMVKHHHTNVNLVCSPHLQQAYLQALKYPGFTTAQISSGISIDETVVQGHYQIYKQHIK